MRARATLAAAAVVAAVLPTPASAQAEHPGKPIYDRWCSECHGENGDGTGSAAAWMLPRPRDFTLANYQIRTTASGELPTDADLMRVIDTGMPGTAMPGWAEALTRQEREALMDYIKTFSRFFENADPQPIEFGSAPGVSDDVLEEGARVYTQLECFKCHGELGRGDGESASTQEDNLGFPIRPADLTQPWYFNGGGTVEDIYRRLRTGLDGTPMPSYADALAAGIVTEEQLWAVAHYVASMGGPTPQVREVIAAERVETLPAAPDDSAWADVERAWVPLVGQIIVKPRWFAPAVTGVWVQAVHDGSEIAVRLSWDDRSRSPDPAWAEWRGRVEEVMAPDEMPGAAPVAAADSAAPPTAVPASPDGLAMWFPRTPPAGMERPYFFMGSTREPVYVWHWTSEAGGREELGRGPGRLEPLGGDGNGLAADAVFDRGQWRLQFRRSLVAADSANALNFPVGQPVPMAFFAWDGDNAEYDLRGSLSTWYFLQLTEPTPPTLYATPVVAMLLTAGLGIFAVGRAQRRERQSSAD